MKATDRARARKNLDKKLSPMRQMDNFTRPPRGWIKAIREALGLTTRQYAKRLGLSQARIVNIEKAELRGSITIDSLRRAAEGLNCRLVYALVPEEPLDEMVNRRATQKAREQLRAASHTMVLENQGIDKNSEDEQLKVLMAKLLTLPGSSLWEDV